MATWKRCGTWSMSLLSWTVFTRMYKKGKDCNPMYLEFQDNISKYYQTIEELQRVKDEIEKKADVNFLKNKIVELTNQISKDKEDLRVLNSELKEENLPELFKKYWETYEETVFGMAIDIYFDDIVCAKLSDFLKERIKDNKKYNEFFALLTAPTKLTTTQEEEIEFLKLLLEEDPDFKNHLDRFAYIPMWFDNDPWSVEDLKKRASVYGRKDDIRDKLQELKGETDRRKKEQQEAIEELNPDSDMLELIGMIQDFAYIRQEGEVQISYHNYHGLPLKEMVCKKLGLTLNDLKFLTDDEILENLQSKHEELHDIIKDRQEYCFMIAKDGVHSIFTGEKAREEAEKVKSLIKDEVKYVDEIRGVIGSTGRAKGEVFVIYGLDDIDKIQKGNIMVVSGTSIEYISAMEKAAGIITEIGGITSHAAIVCRELGKPCIIRIEDATRIFKNGDLVELDAEEGIIRRISKPKAL